ncbi:MAG TPA: response regulator transcription factor [Marinobacterium sp.]|nr:response regulator transcription factor [Marinobacterium sp.]
MSTKILLVDDDTELSGLLAEYLINEGYEVEQADSAEAALARLNAQEVFDLWVLDIMMPGLSGLELLQQVRPRMSTPVIMLTGRGDDIDRILGLEVGADDYLPKPANPRELLARIRAVLRRSQPQPSVGAIAAQHPIHLGSIRLDPQLREAKVEDEMVQLTSAEFNVLNVLMRSAGQIVSKEYLTEQVLHRKLTAYDRAIDVHVSRVRTKLDQAQAGLAESIKTIRGQGYQLAIRDEH